MSRRQPEVDVERRDAVMQSHGIPARAALAHVIGDNAGERVRTSITSALRLPANAPSIDQSTASHRRVVSEITPAGG
jgi:hypothetical protein